MVGGVGNGDFERISVYVGFVFYGFGFGLKLVYWYWMDIWGLIFIVMIDVY